MHIFFLFCVVSDFEGVEEIWEDLNDTESEFLDDHMQPLVTETITPPPLPLNDSQDNSIHQQSIVSWLTGFLLLLQAKYAISDTVIDALTKFLCVFLKVIGNFPPLYHH